MMNLNFNALAQALGFGKPDTSLNPLTTRLLKIPRHEIQRAASNLLGLKSEVQKFISASAGRETDGRLPGRIVAAGFYDILSRFVDFSMFDTWLRAYDEDVSRDGGVAARVAWLRAMKEKGHGETWVWNVWEFWTDTEKVKRLFGFAYGACILHEKEGGVGRCPYEGYCIWSVHLLMIEFVQRIEVSYYRDEGLKKLENKLK